MTGLHLAAVTTVFLGIHSLARAADPGGLVFSVRTWEGEYQTHDVPGGVSITPCRATLHAVDADGGRLRKLVELGPIADNPICSPGGRWVYFQSNATGRYQVYRCRLDGTQIEHLTAGTPLGPQWQGAYCSAFPADGATMAYTVHDGSQGRVVVSAADGSGPYFVAPSLGYTYMAAMSPAGDRMVFSGPARGYRLLIVDLPHGEPRLLTPDHPDCYAPQFTPDGETIVFIRRDGDLYRIDPDGGNLRRLTEGAGYVEFRLSKEDQHGSTDAPGVSPDGGRIAYLAVTDGVPNVWTMAVDGSGQRQVTFRQTPCGRVRWSPDGRSIAFVSFVGKYPQLFVVPEDGGEPRQLTEVEGAVYFASWVR